MLLRDIFKFTKPSRFVLLDSSAGLAKGQEIAPNSIDVDFYKTIKHKSTRPTCRLLLNEVRFDVTASRQLWTKTDISLCNKADHTSSD